MQIIVNSQPQNLPEPATIADLLAVLNLPSTRVAIEVNRTLVRRAQHATHQLAPGDQVEVVTLVGGG